MAGPHITVGIIPDLVPRGALTEVPVMCHAYVVIAPWRTLAAAEVYYRIGPAYLPPSTGRRLGGTFADYYGKELSICLPGWERRSLEDVFDALDPRSELYGYFQSEDRVEAHVWPWPRPPPGAYLHYWVSDIEEPNRWHVACCYHLLGTVWGGPPPALSLSYLLEPALPERSRL